MVNSQRGALVSYNHLISNKREWNNCFIKNAHKISLNLPDLILLEQTSVNSSCRINKSQLSIGEWLRSHEEKTLVIFRSWPRYFGSMYFHVFFDRLSNKLSWLLCLFVIFPVKLHFLVF